MCSFVLAFKIHICVVLVAVLKHMAQNSSLPMRKINEQLIIVQLLVVIFLCINMMLIITFFMRDYFYKNMRYILFATTLLSDCLILVVTNLLFVLFYFRIPVQVWYCLIVVTLSYVYNFVTPVTLTAMTLERYVAICMPLRHAQLCSTHTALWCILIIHGLSSVPCFVVSCIFFASVPLRYCNQYKFCSVDLFLIQTWQRHLRSAIGQLYFFIMCIIIIFCYVRIMKVAKAASGENKKSSGKGLRTVILHAFQLLLCLTQMWCPFIEAAVLKIDFLFFVYVLFCNYVLFMLLPRCLSPLIYGLRDDKFFLSLKYYTFCGYLRNKSLDLTK